MPEVKAVLLVGGLGTRLRPVVSSQPKALASIGGRSFLELLVRQLSAQGIRHLVLCTGYLADQIESLCGDGSDWDVSIEYSREKEPMGTAGAIKLAERYLLGVPEFLVLNGDSFLEIDFRELMTFHRRNQPAVASLAVRQVEDASRYGTVQLDARGRVTGFAEKTGSPAPGLVNAGIYVFSESVWRSIPQGPASLEKEVFPELLKQGVYAHEQHGIFIDIGTPADYARAQELLRSV
jgi:NDP-sugar pyrophosphorylase family protein